MRSEEPAPIQLTLPRVVLLKAASFETAKARAPRDEWERNVGFTPLLPALRQALGRSAGDSQAAQTAKAVLRPNENAKGAEFS